MSDSNSKTALDSIVKAVIDRDGSSTADTMLVNAHLSQMKMFGIRQGVEFFPQQDNLGTQRFDFIQQVIKFNTLDARLDSIWDRFLAYGKGLFYIRPTRKTYRIYWFDKDSYRTYYTPEGDLEEVIIIYPYKVRSKKGFKGAGLNTDKRYMRLRITATEIEEFHSEQEITFEQENVSFASQNKKILENTMEFIPCVEVFNNPVNVFVATFIGSPPMNIIECSVLEKNNELMIEFDDNIILKCPKNIMSKIKNSKKVIIGIRAEDIVPFNKNSLESEEAWFFEKTIELAEPLGTETQLFFKLRDIEIISRMYNPRPVSVGEKLGFQIDVNKVHFFDYETEKAI